MSSQFFGTDGIRGPAGSYPLNDEGMLQIGKAIGAYFTRSGSRILVGWDPRESSEGLVAPLVEGLAAMGAEVHKLGVLPTPGLAYLSRPSEVKAGVMVTASHNPYTDNGVKIFTENGRKLPDKDQDGLNRLIDSDIKDGNPGSVSDDPSAIKAYEDFLVDSAGGVSFDGLRLAVDAANGAGSYIAARTFERLGADVTALSDRPDGKNINVDCGATDTAALEATVKEQGLDCGIALDGDGDRVIMVDGKGRQLSGDHILYILAVTVKYRGVAATIMSNQGLENALIDHGIAFRRTQVGDRAVLAELDKSGFRLGGEQSGHIIIADKSETGDGLLAAICTLSAAKTSGKSLAQWYDELKLLPQALVSVPFPDKSRLDQPRIQEFIKAEADALGSEGRLNVRPSGTEPKVRIMVEAPDAEERADAIARKLTKLIAKGGAS